MHIQADQTEARALTATIALQQDKHMKIKVWAFLFLGLVLCTRGGLAQGTFLWTWHGESNFFSGSFEVTADDMQPSGAFTSQLFRDSVHFVAPDGYVFDSSQLSMQPSGYFSPSATPILGLDIRFFNPITVRGIDVFASPTYGAAYIMGGGAPVGLYEDGYWTYTPTPEPSTATLFGLGGLAWAAVTVRQRCRRKA